MHIGQVSPASESRAPLVGVRDEGQVFGLPGVGSLADLWALPLAEIRQRVAERERVPATDVTLLAPVDGRTEVGRGRHVLLLARGAGRGERALGRRLPAGLRRRTARVVLQVGGVAGGRRRADDRGPGRPGVGRPGARGRQVINRLGEIAGYTACNDVSSRSIEGENPLYLPQAKIYLGGWRWARPSAPPGRSRTRTTSASS